MVIIASCNSSWSQVQMQLKSQAKLKHGARERPASSPRPASASRLGGNKLLAALEIHVFSWSHYRPYLCSQIFVASELKEEDGNLLVKMAAASEVGEGGWNEGRPGRQNTLFHKLGSQGWLHKVPWIGSLNVGNVLSHGSWSWKFKIKVLAEFFPSVGGARSLLFSWCLADI